jgi:hypothetical protein
MHHPDLKHTYTNLLASANSKHRLSRSINLCVYNNLQVVNTRLFSCLRNPSNLLDLIFIIFWIVKPIKFVDVATLRQIVPC